MLLYGFGLSETREALRDYFEVSAGWIGFAALSLLSQNNLADAGLAREFARAHDLALKKTDPFYQ